MAFTELTNAEKLLISIEEAIRKSASAILQVTPDELKSFVNGQVSVDFKKLRGPVILTDTLPRTALGKLKRREMREWAIKNIKY